MKEQGLSHGQKVAIFSFAITALVAVNLFTGKGLLPAKAPATSAQGETAPSPGEKSTLPAEQSRPPEPPPQPAVNIDPMGSPDAKVKLKAFVQPSNSCHGSTIAILKKVARALPNRIHLEFVDTASEEGSRKSEEANLNCSAALMVNGKSEFEIVNAGKKQKVAFNHGPVHMMPPAYLITAVTGELRTQYGDAITQVELNKLAHAIKNAYPEANESPEQPAPKRPTIPHPALD